MTVLAPFANLPVITRAMCPSAEQEMIVLRLAAGDRLAGPALVRCHGRQRGRRDWLFASGIRANANAVAALARRGVLAVEADGAGHRASLVDPANPFGGHLS